MRKYCLALSAIAFAIAGCAEDSQLPVATGKGRIAAINAVEQSPIVAFRIQERTLAELRYSEGSESDSWDDLDYDFNFDIQLPGDDEVTRIATQPLKVDADQNYTLVLTGTIDTPSVTVWQTPEREFADGGTVFEVRFAHLAESLGRLDYYFAPAGTAPVLGEQRGTLSFGEVLDPIDIEAGDYVLSVTPEGDPATIVFQSVSEPYAASFSSIFALFDSDEQSTAPQRVRLFGQTGGSLTLQDARFPPAARFIHASFTLPPSDIYDDEMVSNLVVANHQFGDTTAELTVAVGDTDYTYTAVGNSSATQFEFLLSADLGRRYNIVVAGDDAARLAVVYTPDRRSASTSARFTVFHAAADQEFVDVYVVERGAMITDDDRVLQGVRFEFLSANITQPAGSYDVYVTTLDEIDDVLAGPLPLDLALGDVVELLLLDTVDPTASELRLIPAP